MQKLVESPEAFRSFFEKEFFMDNKGIIISNLSMLHAALRRVRVTLVDGEAVRPHPAYDITRQLLPFVFQYVKLVYYLIELQEFKDVLDMTEVEKTQVLGFVQSPGSCTYSQNSSSSTVNAEHIPAPQDASELYPVLVKVAQYFLLFIFLRFLKLLFSFFRRNSSIILWKTRTVFSELAVPYSLLTFTLYRKLKKPISILSVGNYES